MAGGDQQFCLRWNNHQTTLTSIFGELLEAGDLLDCTLAAEGRALKAHRILLSACSPYFKTLLGEYAEGNPIVILKDVKFKELCALMDYMYKGEVNISQDELAELLKVAEHLQIKGLSDGAEKTDERPVRKRVAAPQPQPSQPIVPQSATPAEQRRSNYLSNDLQADLPTSADSPVPRKRKRARRRSSGDESGLQSQTANEPVNSSLVILPLPRLQVTSTGSSKTAAVIPETPTTVERPLIPDPPAIPVIVPKTELPIEQVLIPKEELDDTANENDYEDLTMDDDNDMDDSQPGPSHGSEGSSNQGYPPWQMGADGSIDDDMQPQGPVGGIRDAQGVCRDSSSDPKRYKCQGCTSTYKNKRDLTRHMKEDCGRVEPLVCPNCHKRFTLTRNLSRHIRHECGDEPRIPCKVCGALFRTASTLYQHSYFECGKGPQFPCPHCDYRSKQKCNLKYHLRTKHPLVFK